MLRVRRNTAQRVDAPLQFLCNVGVYAPVGRDDASAAYAPDGPSDGSYHGFSSGVSRPSCTALYWR